MSDSITGFLLGSAVTSGIAIGLFKYVIKDVNGIGKKLRTVIAEQIIALLCRDCKAHEHIIRRLLG